MVESILFDCLTQFFPIGFSWNEDIFLAKNQMHYGSPEALEFTSLYFMLLNYWTFSFERYGAG